MKFLTFLSILLWVSFDFKNVEAACSVGQYDWPPWNPTSCIDTNPIDYQVALDFITQCPTCYSTTSPSYTTGICAGVPNVNLLYFKCTSGKITYINVAGFDGTMPKSIGRLSELITVDYEPTNSLTHKMYGTLPTELGLLTKMMTFRPSKQPRYTTLITGSIPSELANCKALQTLNIISTQLSGTIPSELGALPSIIDFRVGGWVDVNGGAVAPLSGTIPTELGNHIKSNSWFSIKFTNVADIIPDSFVDVTGLTNVTVDMTNNYLYGTVPQNLLTVGGEWRLTENRFVCTSAATYSGSSVVLVYSTCGTPTCTAPKVAVNSATTTCGCPSGQFPWPVLTATSCINTYPPDYQSALDIINQCTACFSSFPYTTGVCGWTATDFTKPYMACNSGGRVNHFNVRGFTGTFPTTIGKLTYMDNIIYAAGSNAYNFMTGSIPTEIGLLTKMTTFSPATSTFPSTLLDTTIPSEMGLLTSLQYFNLFSTKLKGTLAPELGNMAALIELRLGGTSTGTSALEGTIPTQLGNFVKASKTIQLNYNILTGTLPTTFYSTNFVSNVPVVDLKFNNLLGDVPGTLGTKGTQYTLTNNYFTCSSASLYSISANVAVYSTCTAGLSCPSPQVSVNSNTCGCSTMKYAFSGGCVDTHLTDYLGVAMAFSSLHAAAFTTISFGDGVCSDYNSGATTANQFRCNAWGRIDQVLLKGKAGSGTAYTGSIPAAINNLAYLTSFQNDGASLSGTLSANLFNPKYARTFDLLITSSALTGTIPTNLIQTPNIVTQFVLVGGASTTTQTLPTQIGAFPNLTKLLLSNWKFSNTQVPTQLTSGFASISDITYFQINTCQLKGSIPTEWFSYPKLATLSIYDNLLTGTIPTQIGNSVLKTIFIRNNQLTGTLPTQLFGGYVLASLDARDNLLSGSLPSNLATIFPTQAQVAGGNYFECTGLPDYSASTTDDYVTLSTTCNTCGLACFGLGYCLTNGTSCLCDSGNFFYNSTLCTNTNAVDYGVILKFVASDPTIFDDPYTNGFCGYSAGTATYPTAITCSGGKITNLVLGANSGGSASYNGIIPTEIGQLTSLGEFSITNKIFGLDTTGVKGTIPTQLASINNLNITLNGNLLDTPLVIPWQFSNVTNPIFSMWRATTAGISDARTIDPGFWKKPGMVKLQISGYRFAYADFPKLICNFPQPQLFNYIIFENGNINDYVRIDSCIGNFVNLQNLNFYQNNIIGSIPTDILLLTQLTSLKLGYSNATFTLPTQWGKLTTLNLIKSYGISGTIPTEISGSSTLVTLNLQETAVSGTISSAFFDSTKCSYRSYINFQDTEIEGNLPNVTAPVGGCYENGVYITRTKIRCSTLPDYRGWSNSGKTNHDYTTSLTNCGNCANNTLTDLGICNSLGTCSVGATCYCDSTSPKSFQHATNSYNCMNTDPVDYSVMTKIVSNSGNDLYSCCDYSKGYCNSATNTCGSHSISCSTTTGKITKLTLSSGYYDALACPTGGNYFNGVLPTELGLLTSLQSLTVNSKAASDCSDSGAALRGTIPSQLALIDSLTTISTSNSWMNGNPIPSQFAASKGLTQVTLSRRCIDGGNSNTNGADIQWMNSWISQNLTLFRFSNFNVNTTFPFEPLFLTQGSTKLTSFFFTGNRIASYDITAILNSLPTKFPVLSTFQMQTNSLIGTIPANLFNHPTLTSFDVLSNLITGTIPTQIATAPKMISFRVSQNDMSGTLPIELTKAGTKTQITTLRLDSNNFYGTIPVGINTTLYSVDLKLAGNYFSCVNLPNYSLGAVTPSSDYSTSVSNCAGCEGINNCNNIGYCSVSGGCYCNNMPSFPYMNTCTNTDLSDLAVLIEINSTSPNAFPGINWLLGPCGSVFGSGSKVICDSLGKVTTLILGADTPLVGTIPKSLASLTELTVLTLSGSTINGDIPTELGSLKKMTALNIYGTNLRGTIPTELGFLNQTYQLGIFDNNYLSGSIPTELGSLKQLQSLYLQNNWLTGTIPTQIFTGPGGNLFEVFLNSNQLDGTIPTVAGGLSSGSLYKLRLNDNLLSGTIPTQLSYVVTELFLADNKIRCSDLFDYSVYVTLLSDYHGSYLNCRPPNCQDPTCNGYGVCSIDAKCTCTAPDTFPSGVTCTTTNPTDEQVFLKFYNQDPTSFPSYTPILGACGMPQWSLNYVNCTAGNIVELHLDQESPTPLSFTGTIPTEIALLTSSFRVFSSKSQTLSGVFPTELGSGPVNPNLEILVENAQIVGRVPTQLGSRPNLAKFRWVNAFGFSDPTQASFSIPTQLGFLTGLLELTLGNLPVSGTSFPIQLQNCNSLRVLQMSNLTNFKPSNIPSWFSTVNSLQTLKLEGLKMTGSILAASIPSTLVSLSLKNNLLSSTFPTGLFSQLTSIDISNNQFTGGVPASPPMQYDSLKLAGNLFVCANLANYSTWTFEKVQNDYDEAVRLCENCTSYSGNCNSLGNCSAKGICSCSSVSPLSFSFFGSCVDTNPVDMQFANDLILSGEELFPGLQWRNGICNDSPTFVCDSQGKISSIYINDGNSLLRNSKMVLPQSLALLTELNSLNIYGMGGSLPPSLSKLTKLTSFKIYGSDLKGTLPTELASTASSLITELKIERLSLGPINPYENGNFSDSTGLTFPSGLIQNLQLATSISIKNFNYTGTFPSAALQTLGSGLTTLDLSGNCFTGFTSSSSNLLFLFNGVMFSSLATIGLENTCLTGTAPAIYPANSLVNLMFSGNKLTGTIPTELILSLFPRSILKLSNNLLSGTIPIALNGRYTSQLLLDGNEFNCLTNYSSFSVQTSYLNDFGSCSSVGWLASSNFTACNDLGYPVTSGRCICTTAASLAQNNTCFMMDWQDQLNLQPLIIQRVDLFGLSQIQYQRGPCNITTAFLQIDCNSNGRITYLYASNTNTSLPIVLPDSLGNLRYLKKLVAFGKGIIGTIPLGISGSVTINNLNITQTQNSIFSLSSFLTNPSFTHLILSYIGSSFSSSLPSVTSFSNLTYLDLSGNNLVGGLGNLVGSVYYSKLAYINLSNNQLSGTLPLAYSNSIISGSILDLRANKLYGSIPSTLSGMFPGGLYLSYNPLTCSGLSTYSSFAILTDYSQALAQCSPTYCPQPSCGGFGYCVINQGCLCTSPNTFSYQGRCIDTYPDDYAVYTEIKSFSSPSSQLFTYTDDIKGVCGNFSVVGSYITCSSSGKIKALSLRASGISGSLPGILSILSELEDLDLSQNLITGSLVVFEGNSFVPNLKYLNLAGNQLIGSIPTELMGRTALTVLDLSENTGLTLPSLPNPNVTASSNLRSLNLKGIFSLTASLSQLMNFIGASIVSLDLTNTKISGAISQIFETVNLPAISSLYVSYNQLSGTLPKEFPATLSGLDVRSNKLSGVIPVSVSTLNSVALFLGTENKYICPIPGYYNSILNDFDQVSSACNLACPASPAIQCSGYGSCSLNSTCECAPCRQGLTCNSYLESSCSLCDLNSITCNPGYGCEVIGNQTECVQTSSECFHGGIYIPTKGCSCLSGYSGNRCEKASYLDVCNLPESSSTITDPGLTYRADLSSINSDGSWTLVFGYLPVSGRVLNSATLGSTASCTYPSQISSSFRKGYDPETCTDLLITTYTPSQLTSSCGMVSVQQNQFGSYMTGSVYLEVATPIGGSGTFSRKRDNLPVFLLSTSIITLQIQLPSQVTVQTSSSQVSGAVSLGAFLIQQTYIPALDSLTFRVQTTVQVPYKLLSISSVSFTRSIANYVNDYIDKSISDVSCGSVDCIQVTTMVFKNFTALLGCNPSGLYNITWNYGCPLTGYQNLLCPGSGSLLTQLSSYSFMVSNANMCNQVIIEPQLTIISAVSNTPVFPTTINPSTLQFYIGDPIYLMVKIISPVSVAQLTLTALNLTYPDFSVTKSIIGHPGITSSYSLLTNTSTVTIPLTYGNSSYDLFTYEEIILYQESGVINFGFTSKLQVAYTSITSRKRSSTIIGVYDLPVSFKTSSLILRSPTSAPTPSPTNATTGSSISPLWLFFAIVGSVLFSLIVVEIVFTVFNKHSSKKLALSEKNK